MGLVLCLFMFSISPHLFLVAYIYESVSATLSLLIKNLVVIYLLKLLSLRVLLIFRGPPGYERLLGTRWKTLSLMFFPQILCFIWSLKKNEHKCFKKSVSYSNVFL